MIQLTALEPEDLEILYTIENDPAMWNVGSSTAPYSRYDLKDYILNQQHDIYADKQLRLVIRKDERAVGLIDLFNFDARHLRAEMGLAILSEEQGRGYASEAIRMLKEYAVSVLHLHQLYCIVPADNEPSLTMLRKAHFSEAALLKDWLLTTDGWVDAVQLHYFFK